MSSKKITKDISNVEAVLRRLMTASGAATQAALADFLGTQQPAIARALSRAEIPELWLYKVAEKTGYRREWLQSGQGPESDSALIQGLLDQISKIKISPSDIGKPNKDLARIMSAVSEIEHLVKLAEVSSQYALKMKPHVIPGVDASGLDEEEKATVGRLIAAFKSGDSLVRSHLIGQLRLIDELVRAKQSEPRTRAKKAAE